ncbi:hypothetical protein ACP70R_003697 [Stipagrostis hirtigluma subsp. patula]
MASDKKVPLLPPPPPPPLQHGAMGRPLAADPRRPAQPQEQGAGSVVEAGDGGGSGRVDVQLSLGSPPGDAAMEVPAVHLRRRRSPPPRSGEADGLLREDGVAGGGVVREPSVVVAGGGASAEDSRAYECPFCSATYTRLTAMYGHMKTHERDPGDVAPASNRERKTPKPATEKTEAHDAEAPPAPALSWGATSRRGRSTVLAGGREEEPPAPKEEEEAPRAAADPSRASAAAMLRDVTGIEVGEDDLDQLTPWVAEKGRAEEGLVFLGAGGEAGRRAGAPVHSDDGDTMNVMGSDNDNAEASNAIVGVVAPGTIAAALAAAIDVVATAAAPGAAARCLNADAEYSNGGHGKAVAVGGESNLLGNTPAPAPSAAAATSGMAVAAAPDAAMGNGKGKAIAIGGENKQPGSKYPCHLCDKTFSCHQALGGHIAGHKNRERMTREMLEREPHVCRHCSTAFLTRQGLSAHMTTDHPRAQLGTKDAGNGGGSSAVSRPDSAAGSSRSPFVFTLLKQDEEDEQRQEAVAGNSSAVADNGRANAIGRAAHTFPSAVLVLPALRQVVAPMEGMATVGNGPARLVPASDTAIASSPVATTSTVTPAIPLQNQEGNPPEGTAMRSGNGERATIRIFGVDIAKGMTEEPKE